MAKRTKRQLSFRRPKRGAPAVQVPRTFPESLIYCMGQRGDTVSSLLAAIEIDASRRQTVWLWLKGTSAPRHHKSFRLLALVEKRYKLPDRFFRSQLCGELTARAIVTGKMSAKDKYVADLHLPGDFDERSPEEQEEIISWIKENVLSATTDYGKFLSQTAKDRYAVLFPTVLRARKYLPAISLPKLPNILGNLKAPPALADEMHDLIRFHTTSLSPTGFKRIRPWKRQTVISHVRNFGIMFGALCASPGSSVAGMGVPITKLTFGLMVFPQFWDWLLQWREKRRGFFTVAERSTLYVAIGFTRKVTGWLRQHPVLADRLKPIERFVTAEQIRLAKANWNAACDNTFEFAQHRLREIATLVKCHRSSFEPIMPILKDPSPLQQFRRVTEEILKDARAMDSPIEQSRAFRAYLMLRLGAHLGLRQRNLRELLLSEKGSKPRTTKVLQDLERGEMRWNQERQCWSVFVPAVAFKNWNSSFFRGHPYELDLPDLADLYSILDRYISIDRKLIIGSLNDPGTLFVRSGRLPGNSCEYTMHTFYDAWKFAIQRHGIYNPYTRRGAIKGLLPHGPHCVRDVLATHILKMTGSFDLASYAIQDSAETVMRHYGRFLPEEKAAQAALILNEVWDDTKVPGDWARHLIEDAPQRLAL